MEAPSSGVRTTIFVVSRFYLSRRKKKTKERIVFTVSRFEAFVAEHLRPNFDNKCEPNRVPPRRDIRVER